VLRVKSANVLQMYEAVVYETVRGLGLNTIPQASALSHLEVHACVVYYTAGVSVLDWTLGSFSRSSSV